MIMVSNGDTESFDNELDSFFNTDDLIFGGFSEEDMSLLEPPSHSEQINGTETPTEITIPNYDHDVNCFNLNETEKKYNSANVTPLNVQQPHYNKCYPKNALFTDQDFSALKTILEPENEFNPFFDEEVDCFGPDFPTFDQQHHEYEESKSAYDDNQENMQSKRNMQQPKQNKKNLNYIKKEAKNKNKQSNGSTKRKYTHTPQSFKYNRNCQSVSPKSDKRAIALGTDPRTVEGLDLVTSTKTITVESEMDNKNTIATNLLPLAANAKGVALPQPLGSTLKRRKTLLGRKAYSEPLMSTSELINSNITPETAGNDAVSRSKKNAKRWTNSQDDELKAAVRENNGQNWKAIAKMVTDRDHVQCLQRWKKVLQPGLVKGMWTKEEDVLLLELMNNNSSTAKNWADIAARVPGRTAKQCRERWSLNLDPTINRHAWTQEEDDLLLKLHEKLGNRWAQIKKYLVGRTENGVKTRFKSIERARAKDKEVTWTPELEGQLHDIAVRFNCKIDEVAKHLPRALRGISSKAMRAHCALLRESAKTDKLAAEAAAAAAAAMLKQPEPVLVNKIA